MFSEVVRIRRHFFLFEQLIWEKHNIHSCLIFCKHKQSGSGSCTSCKGFLMAIEQKTVLKKIASLSREKENEKPRNYWDDLLHLVECNSKRCSSVARNSLKLFFFFDFSKQQKTDQTSCFALCMMCRSS